jgi:transposase
MRKVKQILRLKLEVGMSNRAISRACNVGRETIRDYLIRFQESGLTWPEVAQMDEADVEQLLFTNSGSKGCSSKKVAPCWASIHEESKKKGVTLRLLWEEYYQSDPASAYSYSQFCNLYKQWKKKLSPVMVQNYKAGELAFVDYAGVKVPYINRLSGEVKEASIFVAALGASSYTYAEAQESERLDCWIRGHINAFEHFQGVPEIVVPDNLKTGVKSPCYYEPEINPAYDDLSIHYGFVVIPARVKSPRDKAKVETAVQVVERWVLAPVRKRTFFSVDEINEAIKPLLENLNNRQMKHLGRTRRQLFEAIDQPALKPLPQRPYEYAERKTATVAINYHVGFNKHYYSVPYTLVGSKVEIRATATTVEIFHRGQRVASHLRDDTPGRYTTEDSHMPSNHKRRKERWSPERFIRWAQSIGPQTCEVIKELLGSKRHPEQAYKSCMGVLKLADKYTLHRLENACRSANESNLCSYRHIRNILKNNMDKTLTQSSFKAYPVFSHEYVRGQHYYQ